MSLQLAIVAGASKGFGLAIVEALAAGGWRVVGIARSERPGIYPRSAEYVRCDAADIDSVRQFCAQIAPAVSKDSDQVALINCTGLYVSGRFLEIPAEDIARAITSNYTAVIHMTRAFCETFDKGRIVNIVSSSARNAESKSSIYGSAKAATAYLFRAMLSEFPSEQYCITSVFPASIRGREDAPTSGAIEPDELAMFIRQLLEFRGSYFLSECDVLPSGSR